LKILNFNNTFARLGKEFFSKVEPTGLLNPHMVNINVAGLSMLGISEDQINSEDKISPWFIDLCSGNNLPKGCAPLAMVYSGHQFGVYSPELGDGRGLLIGEIEGAMGKWDFYLKGAGKTPYSRFGDGRSVLRSSIREYLCSEAMHALGIETTRALSIFSSEEPVYREKIEHAALLVRLARSHIRFGSFEYFHHTHQYKCIKKLAEHIIEQHLPIFKKSEDRYSQMFRFIVPKTAKTIAKWQSVGFSHGVMNTDNMSILGETLDYGPFGFMDNYDSNFVCNHSDSYGRYSFKNQPGIGLWNCNALASALTSLIDNEQLKSILEEYQPIFTVTLLQLYRQKLGLEIKKGTDQNLIDELLKILEIYQVDYTIFFRRLCFFKPNGNHQHLKQLLIKQNELDDWINQYQKRLTAEPQNDDERKKKMVKHNPKYILRNYMAEIAIQKAETNKDYSEISRMLKLLQSPYDENPECEEYARHPPEWSKEISINCSS
jgi:uncharacterized protein YdiU (UPF0061 family)